MQVTPALPWTAETEGGVIQLATPVTYQQLLDGALQFILKRYANFTLAIVNEGSAGVVIKNVDNQIIYQIGRFDGQSSEINIERADGAPSDWILGNIQLPPTEAISAYPALPWDDTKTSGLIQLANPLSKNQIVNGDLIAIIENEGEELEGTWSINYNAMALKVDDVVEYAVSYLLNGNDTPQPALSMSKISGSGNLKSLSYANEP